MNTQNAHSLSELVAVLNMHHKKILKFSS